MKTKKIQFIFAVSRRTKTFKTMKRRWNWNSSHFSQPRFLFFFLSIRTIMTESWRNRIDLEQQATRWVDYDGGFVMRGISILVELGGNYLVLTIVVYEVHGANWISTSCNNTVEGRSSIGYAREPRHRRVHRRR